MDLYIDELRRGYLEVVSLYKQGENIFEMGSGTMFPTHDKQQTWQFARGDKHIRLSDGTNLHHFNVTSGGLNGEEADLERIPDVPMNDLFTNATSKGKAQVHRSDPASVYFTLQEGTKNPTYTFKHIGGAKWKAIPKKVTPKQHLNQPAPIPNVNVEGFKSAMEKTSLFNELDSAIGKGVINGGNALVKGLLSPGMIRMPFTNGYGVAARQYEAKDALMASLVGAGLGGGYHLAKKHLLNTPEENEDEAQDPHLLAKRMAIPGLGMGLASSAMNSISSQKDRSGYFDRAVQGRPYNFLGS